MARSKTIFDFLKDLQNEIDEVTSDSVRSSLQDAYDKVHECVDSMELKAGRMKDLIDELQDLFS